MEDLISEYETSLNDLRRNNKSLINVLTILAEEGINFAVQIVQVIENHIGKVFNQPYLWRLLMDEDGCKTTTGIIAYANMRFVPSQPVQLMKLLVDMKRKLSTLYLIDSLMKNVGRDYLRRVALKPALAMALMSMYVEADEQTRLFMYHLRRTWTEILPDSTLYAIDAVARHIDDEWPFASAP